MNILHLLSQTHLTGAEVYATTLIKNQVDLGHQVYQISNDFFHPSLAEQIKLNVECPTKYEFLINIFKLRSFFKKNNIQIIHCHSRAATKLAFYSTFFSKVAYVSSVHGIQHSSISKKLFSQYGQFILAVCKNIKTHLIEDFSYNEKIIKIIPNPISNKQFQFINKKNTPQKIKIGIVGRTTGPKATRTELIINELFSSKLSELVDSITVVGGQINQLNLPPNLKSKIIEVSPKELTSTDYQVFDLVIGSGRVCMESLMSGVPCIAFGESQYCGLISINNFYYFLESNFGDIQKNNLIPKIDSEKLLTDINTLMQNYTTNKNDLFGLSQLAEQTFNISRINSQIIRLYESAYFLKQYKKWIPVLMYHKIPSNEIQSQHKIFVTTENFKKHLSFFKKRGFKTVTFSELALYRKGQLSFKSFPKKPLILTFDDGYVDNLENASPLLKQFGFRAQIFLLANSQIKSNQWDSSLTEPLHEIVSGTERLKWKQSAFEVGSHGFSHQKITDMSSTEIIEELEKSKQQLEKEFNTEINVYAFTYGITSDEAKQIAQNVGYDYAVNTDSGARLLEEDPYSIFRVNIFPNESFWSLYKKTSTWYRAYYYHKRKK